jgi:Ca-activated chloride channel family protein
MQKALEDVETYDDQNTCLGGTEIYKPLEDIFKMPVEKDMVRQIFLLTDGAVHNTSNIVELIDKHAVETNSRIHTFGIGRDCSQELVEEAANAGCGSYNFIINNEEIEEQVIAALQKNYAAVRTIKKIEAIDA